MFATIVGLGLMMLVGCALVVYGAVFILAFHKITSDSGDAFVGIIMILLGVAVLYYTGTESPFYIGVK